MTSNIQLENYLKDKKTFAPFKGVFCSSNLPELKKKEPFCLIVNYDPCDKGGSHWCAMGYYNHTPVWFDSYGLGADSDDIILDDTTHFTQYLKNHSGDKKIKYNSRDFQHLDSKTCGLWSVLFCQYGLPEENKKPWYYFRKFDTRFNDSVVKKLVPIKLT